MNLLGAAGAVAKGARLQSDRAAQRREQAEASQYRGLQMQKLQNDMQYEQSIRSREASNLDLARAAKESGVVGHYVSVMSSPKANDQEVASAFQDMLKYIPEDRYSSFVEQHNSLQQKQLERRERYQNRKSQINALEIQHPWYDVQTDDLGFITGYRIKDKSEVDPQALENYNLTKAEAYAKNAAAGKSIIEERNALDKMTANFRDDAWDQAVRLAQVDKDYGAGSSIDFSTMAPEYQALASLLGTDRKPPKRRHLLEAATRLLSASEYRSLVPRYDLAYKQQFNPYTMLGLDLTADDQKTIKQLSGVATGGNAATATPDPTAQGDGKYPNPAAAMRAGDFDAAIMFYPKQIWPEMLNNPRIDKRVKDAIRKQLGGGDSSGLDISTQTGYSIGRPVMDRAQSSLELTGTKNRGSFYNPEPAGANPRGVS